MIVRTFNIIRTHWGFVAICSTVLLLYLFLIYFIPPDMDEFAYHHALACWQFPYSFTNIFREACNGIYDLSVFSTYLPLRSSPYTGISLSLIYYPLYLLWNDYHSTRILGIISLFLIAYLITRITKAKFIEIAPLILFSLPIVFQMLVDTGPIVYQTAMVLLIPFLLYKYYKNIFWAFLCGLLLFLGIEQKPLFVLVLPSIGIFTLFLLYPKFTQGENKEKLRIILNLTVAFLTVAILTAILFYLPTRTGIPYWDQLRSHSPIGLLDFTSQWRHFGEKLFPFFYSFVNFGHRIYGMKDSFDMLTLLFWLFVLVLVIINIVLLVYPKESTKEERGINKDDVRLILGGLLSFLLVLGLINLTAESDSGHHIIFAFPFLYICIAILLKLVRKFYKQIAVLLYTGIILINVLLGFSVLSFQPEATDEWSRVRIIEDLQKNEIAHNNIYVVLDWGVYYILSLFGSKDQMVLYIQPLNDLSQVQEVKTIAQKYNRDLIFIARKQSVSNISLIESYFYPIEKISYPQESRTDSWWMFKASI